MREYTATPTKAESSQVEEKAQTKQSPKQSKPETKLAIKKGNSSWSPASLNEFSNKEPGFRYRMSRKDAENLSKKSQEGWETVSGIQSGNVEHQSTGRMDDGVSVTSVLEGKDWILQRIPEELAVGRDEYYNGEVDRRTQGLTAHVKKEIGKSGANTHGEITISSRLGTQTID